MPTVWMINHYAQEPGGPGGTRHFSLSKHLAAHGWEGVVIASSVEHNSGRQRLAAKEKKRLNIYEGVKFLWVRGSKYSGNGGDRVRNMLGFSFTILTNRILQDLPPPDIIIGSSVHPFAALAGLVLARRHKVPFIFEVRDLWPETLIAMKRIKPWSPTALILSIIERVLYHNAVKTIAVLPHADDYIAELGFDRNKVIWIPNGVELGAPPAAGVATTNSKFTLMYFGAHGAANGLQTVLDAMKFVQDDERGQKIRLRLIGDGPEKPDLVQYAQGIKLNNVSFEPPIPKSAIPDIASQADCFVFNLIDAPVFKYGISSNKLFDFMAASRPTIFCSNSVNNPIADSDGGIHIRAERPRDLASAILYLAEMPLSERQKMGISARDHVEKAYGFSYLASLLAGTLNEAIETK